MLPPTPTQAPQLGASMRALRLGADLSIGEVARRIDVTKSTLSRFERGERVISEEALAKFVAVMAAEIGSRRAA